jgi:hypothetical protein
MSNRGKSTPDQPRNTRVRAWASVFDSYAKKSTATASGDEDAMKGSKNEGAIYELTEFYTGDATS